MKLLVSVADSEDAAAAIAGGADIVDAKDPLTGALGAVSNHLFREICEAVGSTRPLSAAIGDADDEDALERAAHDFAAAGATFVKIGFLRATAIDSMLDAAVRGVRDTACRVIGVAYVDIDVNAGVILDAVSRAGAAGVLLDTNDKRGPGLRQLITPAGLARVVATAHDAGLLAAVAGKLTADDLGFARDAGADIAGVRGAACVGGRDGRVSAERVRLLANVVQNAGEQIDLVGRHAG